MFGIKSQLRTSLAAWLLLGRVKFPAVMERAKFNEASGNVETGTGAGD